MSAVPVRTHVRVENISTHLTSTGTSFANPPIYLWSVFFKVDGDKAQVDVKQVSPPSWNLQGAATVAGTPGDQGDLPGGVRASYYVDEKTVIPAPLGDYVTTLAPFPVSAGSGFTVGGMIVGWLGILLYQQNTPADVVTAGHQALDGAVLQALNNVIPTITNKNQTITQGDISNAVTLIQTQVTNAIINALSFGDKLRTVLNTEFQDSFVGNALAYFTDSQLLGSPPQGIPLKYSFNWGGKLDPRLYTFTFNGTVVADQHPFSLRRILTGLGHAPPADVRKVMGAHVTPSLLAWIETVR